MKSEGKLGLMGIRGGVLIISLCVCFLSSNLYAQPVTINIHVEGDEYYGDAPIYTSIDWDDVYANPDQEYNWYLQDPIDIAATDNPDIILATVDGLSTVVESDPKINLGFSAAAGQYTTYFSFTSEVMTFETLTNPDAYAWASATALPGDTLTGNYEYGTKSYEALYNGSNAFAHLVDNVTGGTSTEDKGWQTISGDVSSMQSKWWFNLSPNGSASGSSTFEVTPEPATIALLGMGGLLVLRRRKRK